MQLPNMEIPYVLIISAEIGKGVALARDMGAKYIRNGKNDAKYYSYDIDNKYYTAQVMVYITERLKMPLEINVDEIEAVILHYTPKEEDLENLDKYVPLIQSLTDANVYLLACEPFPDIIKKDSTLEWCHMQKFELVDIKLPDETESLGIINDVEEEEYGIARITEALHTHTWSNRILKGFPSGRISTSNESEVTQIEKRFENIQLNPSRNGTEHLLMDSVLDGIMGEDNTNFGELFSQLIAMKEHAASLSPNNRRAAAEQLVTAFWKSLGGDPSEIEDLDE